MGGVITTSSQAALVKGTEFAGLPYMVAKAAVLGLTQGLAGELAALGVTANCVIPGSAHHRTSTPVEESTAKRVVAERVSPIVAFLASPRAHGISGAVFQSLGGRIDRVEPARVRPGIFADKVWEGEEIAALYDDFLDGPAAPTAAEFSSEFMAVIQAGGPPMPATI
jgi:NAD(P)-dependent dehydrogenase (short-subunit alcohol dehydrogenase family)